MFVQNIHKTSEDIIPSAPLKTIFHLITTTDFSTVEDGRYDIQGDDLFYTVNRYTTKDMATAKPEAHQKYVDLQYICSGEESFQWAISDKGLVVDQAYDDKKDIVFYQPSNKLSILNLTAGDMILFLPEEVHTPNCHTDNTPCEMLKIVFKIKASIL